MPRQGHTHKSHSHSCLLPLLGDRSSAPEADRMDRLRADTTRSHTFPNTRASCLFPSGRMCLLKKCHFDNTSASKIFPVFQVKEKLFPAHFRNKPPKHVFCLMSVQAIHHKFADARKA